MFVFVFSSRRVAPFSEFIGWHREFVPLPHRPKTDPSPTEAFFFFNSVSPPAYALLLARPLASRWPQPNQNQDRTCTPLKPIEPTRDPTRSQPETTTTQQQPNPNPAKTHPQHSQSQPESKIWAQPEPNLLSPRTQQDPHQDPTKTQPSQPGTTHRPTSTFTQTQFT